MDELAIQAEVGRRVRAAMKRHPNKFRTNADEGADKERVLMIDELVKSGLFTDQDRGALQAMRPDTLRAVYAKMAGVDTALTLMSKMSATTVGAHESMLPPTMADAMLERGRITPERHKQMKAQERERYQRTLRAQQRRRQPDLEANEAEQEYLKGMLSPSTRRAK